MGVFFDGVFHFGFINDFANPGRAIQEMIRVVRPGGKIVISDDSIPMGTRSSPIAESLIYQNQAFGSEPPLSHLPPDTAYELVWWMGVFYILSFDKKH